MKIEKVGKFVVDLYEKEKYATHIKALNHGLVLKNHTLI